MSDEAAGRKYGDGDRKRHYQYYKGNIMPGHFPFLSFMIQNEEDSL